MHILYNLCNKTRFKTTFAFVKKKKVKSFNRLRAQVGRYRQNLYKWGYYQHPTKTWCEYAGLSLRGCLIFIPLCPWDRGRGGEVLLRSNIIVVPIQRIIKDIKQRRILCNKQLGEIAVLFNLKYKFMEQCKIKNILLTLLCESYS